MKPKPYRTQKETILGLKYIINSPGREYGGFHPNTVEIAKSALHQIEKLQARLRRVKYMGG